MFLFYDICTHPQAQPWLIVPRTIVVHTRFLIKLFGVEEVRRVPRVVAFLDEHFTKWYILNVLRYLAIKVGDVTTATQVVGMVVELHLLVVVIRFEVTVCSPCACPCLCRLRRTIIAAEALTVRVVVIILTIIRLVKRLVVVFNGL